MCALIALLVAVGLLGCVVISAAWAAVVLLSFLGHSFVGILKKARLGR